MQSFLPCSASAPYRGFCKFLLTKFCKICNFVGMSKNSEQEWLPPARDIVAKFKTADITGIRRLADLLSISESSIYRWMYPKNRQGGAGGLIPIDHHRPILELARQLGIPLTPAELTGLTEFEPERPLRKPKSSDDHQQRLPLQAAE